MDRFCVEFWLLMCSDDDIPAPTIPGNVDVVHLDTFAAMLRQSRRARNCLWSPGIFEHVLLRKADLYAVQCSILYTIAVNRRTLDIEQFEGAGRRQLRLGDLRLISDWYESQTQSPRATAGALF
jgi:hypothetical protein